MTQQPNQKPAEDRRETVTEGMDARRVFANADEAANYLNHCAETFKDFGDTPLAAPGMDDEGNFDSAIYGPGIEVMVSTLREQKKGVRAIVVMPVPTLDALLADDAGKSWVQKIIHKELNHVAVRDLRNAANVLTVVDQMPINMTGYITSGQGTSGIMGSYDTLYQELNKDLSTKSKLWNKARFTKGDLKAALESKAFAEEYYPALENRGEGKPSLFALALDSLIIVAKKRGLDPAIFQRWKDTRTTVALADDEDSEDFDADALANSMVSDEAQAPVDAPAEGTPPADESTPDPVEEEPTEENTKPDATPAPEAETTAQA